MTISARHLLAAAALLLAGSLAEAQTLYGVTGSGGAPSSLYRIDAATGATTLIGPTGFSHVSAIDFDPTTGILYGVVSDDDSTGPLIRINLSTGAGTVVAVVGQQIPDFTIGPDGVIHGWSEDTDDPVTIDKATGVVTVTASGLGTSQTGVATATPGTIYVKPGEDLYSVNTSTGVATLLHTFPISMHNLLENEPGGTLLSGTRDGTGTQLYRLDPATGSQTALGHSSQQLSSIAFASAASTAVPALSPLALAVLSLGIALAGLGYWRRN